MLSWRKGILLSRSRKYPMPPDIPAAFEHLDRLVEVTGRTLVHPYDDPVVMAGQGTVGLEMLEDVPDADVVLALYREEMYDQARDITGATELLVRKNRNGRTGYVDLYFYAQWLRFEDMLDPDL